MTSEEARKLFPFAAKIVDEWRALGVDVMLKYAKENGREIGKKCNQS